MEREGWIGDVCERRDPSPPPSHTSSSLPPIHFQAYQSSTVDREGRKCVSSLYFLCVCWNEDMNPSNTDRREMALSLIPSGQVITNISSPIF